MARKKAGLRDEEILNACIAELDAAGSEGGDLSSEREKALDYYLGDMASYLPSEENRSSAVSRDVLDAVEWVLPSLLKIFTDAENALEFAPVGPEDMLAARQETDAVRHVFYEQNDGFLNLYTFCKDALLTKTGVWKIYHREAAWEREDYKNLTAEDVQALLYADDLFEYEILEGDANKDGTYDISLNCRRTKGEICVEPIPPEEFVISARARSPDPKKALFSAHASPKTKSELLEEGWSRKLVDDLPCEEPVMHSVTQARRNLSPEEDWDAILETKSGQAVVWVTECYTPLDRNGDGVAELLKVTIARATGQESAKLMDIEEVDRVPFVAATPVILTHKFYGMSLADLLADIQEIRTSLYRGFLDSIYLANNPRTAVNEAVNLDDMLVSRPGGLVRTEGLDPPGNHFAPIQTAPPPPQAFQMLDILDKMKQHRTGVGDQVMGLDPKSLSSINLGVALQAYEASRMRIELMARIIAECGLKVAFRDIHELMRKHGDRETAMQLRGRWVPVHPAEWKRRTNVRVNVGLGNATKERNQMVGQAILQTQVGMLQTGLPVVTPDNIFRTLADISDAYGKEATLYFTPPQMHPSAQQPPPPDPNMVKLQIEQGRLQIDQAKLQLEQQKMQLEAEIKMRESAAKIAESEIKREIETLKGQAVLARAAVDEQSEVANARAAQMEAMIAAKEAAWQERSDQLKLELDRYKADLQAVTQVQLKVMEIEQRQRESSAEMVALRATMAQKKEQRPAR